MKRKGHKKVTVISKNILPYICTANLFQRLPGCPSSKRRSEIIPVEPDQGNACAGSFTVIQSLVQSSKSVVPALNCRLPTHDFPTGISLSF